jgi:hypothetical protein
MLLIVHSIGASICDKVTVHEAAVDRSATAAPFACRTAGWTSLMNAAGPNGGLLNSGKWSARASVRAQMPADLAARSVKIAASALSVRSLGEHPSRHQQTTVSTVPTTPAKTVYMTGWNTPAMTIVSEINTEATSARITRNCKTRPSNQSTKNKAVMASGRSDRPKGVVLLPLADPEY